MAVFVRTTVFPLRFNPTFSKYRSFEWQSTISTDFYLHPPLTTRTDPRKKSFLKGRRGGGVQL